MPLTVSSGSCRLEITDRPFALRLWREGRLLGEPGLVGRPDQAPFALRRAGRWDSLEEIVSHDLAAGVARLVVRTGGGVECAVDLELAGDLLTVLWSVTENSPGQALQQTLALAPAGHWYGFGHHEPMFWPLETGEITLDPCSASNTRSPLWLTSSGLGLLVPTRETMRLEFNTGDSGLISWGVVDTMQSRFHLIAGSDIEQTRRTAISLLGAPRRRPGRESFTRPIFSTWTQYGHSITQEQTLHLARDIRRYDFPCHVVQVDERWETGHGDLRFDRSKFPDPTGMVDEIHALGYHATLWTCPFVNEDTATFSEEYDTGYMVMDATRRRPAMMRWWHGPAGLVDFSNPAAADEYATRLRRLRDEHGFDGFKMDGGDLRYQPTGADRGFHLLTTPARYCDLYVQFFHDHFYDLVETRTEWLTQASGIMAREGGKDSVWGLNNGLGAVLALGLTQGLLGYPFLIPDMIGGRISTREADLALPGAAMFLRWTQACALLPIMQFSWAPWNYDRNTVDLAREYTCLHEDLAGYWDALADRAVAEGQPMVRPLFLQWPGDAETYPIYDQFLVGESLLVAPVITLESRRRVYLPEGEWLDPWGGGSLSGPQWLAEQEYPVEHLPLYVRADRTALAEVVMRRLAGMPRFAGGGRSA